MISFNTLCVGVKVIYFKQITDSPLLTYPQLIVLIALPKSLSSWRIGDLNEGN